MQLTKQLNVLPSDGAAQPRTNQFAEEVALFVDGAAINTADLEATPASPYELDAYTVSGKPGNGYILCIEAVDTEMNGTFFILKFDADFGALPTHLCFVPNMGAPDYTDAYPFVFPGHAAPVSATPVNGVEAGRHILVMFDGVKAYIISHVGTA